MVAFSRSAPVIAHSAMPALSANAGAATAGSIRASTRSASDA